MKDLTKEIKKDEKDKSVEIKDFLLNNESNLIYMYVVNGIQ